VREAVVPTKLVVVRVRAGAELALLAVLSVREALVPAKLAVVRVTQRVDGKANVASFPASVEAHLATTGAPSPSPPAHKL
jgi:hypothetical protein